jgi:hypothetical protein
MNTRGLLLLLITVLLLPACSLSAKKVREVDARVVEQQETGLSCFPRDLGRCAVPSPVLELGRQATRDGLHRLALVEYGEDALKLRIHMIRAAQRYVELQNFILRGDGPPGRQGAIAAGPDVFILGRRIPGAVDDGPQQFRNPLLQSFVLQGQNGQS